MNFKIVVIYLMAILYIAAGVYHFVNPATYLRIMPPYIPYHQLMVAVSGIAEIICGVLLLYPKTRRLGAWCTIGLLISVYPANIQMAVNYYQEHNPKFWVAIVRLPIQFLLIWWAYVYAKREK